MRHPLKIVLVGMPGSGKSTFGRKIARKLSFVFIDLDHLIEKEEGRAIKDIFSEEGEGKFRELETLYLNRALDNVEGFVLSTGGGTPCFNDNMNLLNDKGISVYLDVPLKELQRRLTTDSVNQRPLFVGMNTAQITLELKNMMAIRGYYYEKAKIKLSGDNLSTELLMAELLNFI